jgi:hypothetical protein
MECYICYEKESSSNKFCDYLPCKCKGTNKIHFKCLEELKKKCGDTCTICKSKYGKSKEPVKKTRLDPIIISRLPEREIYRPEYVPVSRNVRIENTFTPSTIPYNRENSRRVQLISHICEDNDELYNYILQVSALESYGKNKNDKDGKIPNQCCSII